MFQEGLLIQSSGRGGEASTSGKGAVAATAKGRVAYVGPEPTNAELLKSKVADDGAERRSRFAASVFTVVTLPQMQG